MIYADYHHLYNSILLLTPFSTVDIRSHSFMARSQYITISIVSSLVLHLVIEFPLYFPIILPTASHSKRCSVVSNSCLHTLHYSGFPKFAPMLHMFNFTFRILAISSALQCFIYSFSPNSLPFKISTFSLLLSSSQLLFSLTHQFSSSVVSSFQIFFVFISCKASRLTFNSSASDFISLIRQSFISYFFCSNNIALQFCHHLISLNVCGASTVYI